MTVTSNPYTSNLLAVFDSRMRRLLGEDFTVVVSVPLMDPCARVQAWVACKKHKTHKIVDIPDDGFPSDEHMLKLAQSCEGCIAEHAAELPPTRWPEGAEL